MKLRDDIEAAHGDPAGLERLYRTAQAEGNADAFREALRQSAEAQPADVLLAAWAHRLDLPMAREETESESGRRWWVVIGVSVVVGVVSALLAGGKPPVPDPSSSNLLFWVGWGPLVALGVLGYLAWSEPIPRRRVRYAIAAVAVVLVGLYAGLTLGGQTGDASVLAAVHLPFVSWAAVGAALCLGYPNPARQSFAFLAKSVETVLTGGIFFGAGLIFVGLTFGIFEVLGVELAEEDLVVLAGWAVGAVPLLALGSAYDATASPVAQDWQTGLTRTLRILARLLLPLALGVLLVYVLWFIPAYFRKPFEEREVLLVYNATIMAILVLLTVVVSDPTEAMTGGRGSVFRYAVLSLGGLTLVLNVYALAAVTSRALGAGLTPNRFAVIGWNVVTLLILAAVGARLWKARRRPWASILRESMGLLAALAGIWTLSLLLALPLFN